MLHADPNPVPEPDPEWIPVTIPLWGNEKLRFLLFRLRFQNPAASPPIILLTQIRIQTQKAEKYGTGTKKALHGGTIVHWPAATEGRLEAEVNVFLGVQANQVGRDVHHLGQKKASGQADF